MRERIIVLLILFFSGCRPGSIKELLADADWSEMKVVNLQNGATRYYEKGQKVIWTFNQNNTFQYEFYDGKERKNNDGKWDLKGDRLILITVSDTLNIQIEKISNDEMIWRNNSRGETTRIFLNAKGKKMVMPNFLHDANSESNNTNIKK